MPDVRPIIFGPGDKLAWLEAIAVHPKSTDLDVRVGVAIVNRLDKFTGRSLVSQGWIARWIGRKPHKTRGAELLPQTEANQEPKPSERGVQDSVRRLKRNSLLLVSPGGGRGKANVYQPLIAGQPKRHGQPWSIVGRNHTPSREASGETTRPGVENHTPRRRKPHAQPCTLPNDIPKSLPNDYDHDDERDWNARASENEEAWNSIKGQLVTTIGPDLTRSWFDRVSIRSFDGEELQLLAGVFQVSRIKQEYMPPLLAACRYEYPSLKRVHLISTPATHLRAAE